jgi:hypothetical protein
VLLSCAVLPGVRTWKLDASHGDLPKKASAFPAFVELLVKGDTQLLDTLDATHGAASAAATVMSTAALHSRPSRGLLGSDPPSSLADVLSSPARFATDDRRAGVTLHVSVLNVDLKFVHQPLLVGHYRSMGLTGTEDVVDRLVAGAMRKSLSAGLYPDAVGTHQIFGNIRRDPQNVLAMARPLAVVVAGLGEEGKLRAVDLSWLVRQSVLAYAQRLAERAAGAPAEIFATTFYDTLLGGGRFIEAVAAARGAAWRANPDGNTWAAYQCYGDPGWTWERDGAKAQRAAAAPGDEFTAVSSAPALALALETISIRLRFGGDETKSGSPLQARRDKIRFLESGSRRCGAA